MGVGGWRGPESGQGCREEPEAGAPHKQRVSAQPCRLLCMHPHETELGGRFIRTEISTSHTTIKLIAVGRKFKANDSKV